MRYLGIMFMTVVLTVIACGCGEQDTDSVIIVGPDGRPIDAGACK